MQLQTYTQETKPTNLGDKKLSWVGTIGVEDFGLDTCKWCIGSQHQRCHGSCHKLYDGRGCMCAVCHPEHRQRVIRDRRTCGRVYGHSNGGKALPGSTWAKSKRKNTGISLRGSAGLWQDATSLERLPEAERTYGASTRRSINSGPPKQKLLSDAETQPMFALWRDTANPKSWDDASWELIKAWRDDGMSWVQLEQVTGRAHMRQGFKLWKDKGVLSVLKQVEVWT